ncbi:cation efflux family-domain-containing protein [Phycomyces nitens]|nr:cation efflux family-domain-containing protein [Phycomyces nitens]
MGLSRQTRITLMLFITTGFFLVEIVIGYYVKSLALVADSFHMLNDMLAMGVALWAVRIALKTQWDSKYSYGWQRAEILGALINGVFLVALCFTIVIDAIERFVHPEPVTNPVMVLITGCAGLAGNILGLFLFHEHGHGHSHGHNHNHDNNHNHSHDHSHSHSLGQQDAHYTHKHTQHKHSPEDPKHESSLEANPIDSLHHNHHHDSHEHGGHLNMKGIFLHVLGDALGNVGVIITALFIWLTPFEWRFYLDPIVSLIISIIIFISAVPLVRQTSLILLQGVPSTVCLDDVRLELLQINGILSVHELHIWQLSDTKLIASVHVLLASRSNYMETAAQMRRILHGHGVHSATIQPEFTDIGKSSIEKDISVLVVKDRIVSENIEHAESESSDWSLEANTGEPENRSDLATSTPTAEGVYDQTCLLKCIDASCSENACCPDRFGPN